MLSKVQAVRPTRPARARRTNELLAAALAVESLEARQLLAATLIQDIDPRTASSNPASIVTTPGQAFFLTYDAAAGSPTYYLYHTDATAAGTAPLLSSPSPIGYMAAAGGLAYFDAQQAGISQAWRTDGTAAGTAPLTSFAAAGMTSSSFTDVNGTVFFVAANSVTGGVELWKTGGTAGSTAQVIDASQFASISNLTNVGGTLYFTAAPKATSGDVELWKTDGTAAATVRVKDVRAGTSGSAPSSLTNVNGTLFFIANGGSTTNGLWKSDGTDAGTAFVSPLGGVGQPASPQALTGLGSTLYFTAALGNQRYLFKSDGTSGGTGVVAYITPLVSNGTGFNSAPQGLTPFGGQLYFTAVTPDAGREIWRTDGTGAGTVRVTDVWPGPSSTTPSGLTVFNGAIYFAADDGVSGLELWRTDGTAAGTARVSDGYPGPLSSGPFGLRAMPGVSGGPGRLVFAAMDALHGTELWASDGTAAGTGMVKDVNTTPVGSNPTMLTAVGNRIFFNAAGLLWVSDGTGGHTQSLTGSTIDATGVANSVVDMQSGLPTTLVIGDVLYYVSGGRLWRSDGTRAGTYQVSGAASKLSSLARVGNLIYFSADDGVSGEELWRSDGTAAGTYRLVDIYAGKVSSAPRQITDVNGIAYFRVGSRVYRSDGTPAGTFAITGDIANADSLTGFQRVGNALYFNTFGALWKSDGTAAGTVNVIAGLGLTIAQTSTPRPLGSGVYFLAYTRNSDGWIPGLYKTDGTLAGTALVKVIDTLHTADGQAGYDLTVVGSRLFFTGPDAATLWTSDGTAAGTVIVKAFGAAAPVTALTAVGNTLYFTSGGTLFSSDGTAGGTVAVSNVPAPALTGAGRLAAFDGALAFAATHPLYGAEPWIVDAPTTVPTAPGSLTAAAVSGGEIDLAWVDRSSGESGFRVERSTDPTFATVDSSVLLPPGRTRYGDRLLAAGTTYYYRVVAYSRAGDSAPVTASATTPAGAPTAPTALVAKADGERGVVLTWTGTAANATGYVVQRSADPRFDSIEATFTLPASTVGYTDTTVTALNRYYYRVYATSAGGASEFASAFVATPDRSPAGLQAVGVSPTRIDLRWTNPATTAGTFRIERSRPGESRWTAVWTTAGLEYPDVNPTAGPASVWEYRVVALTAAGDSPSLPVTVSTTAPVLTTPVKSLPPVVDSRGGSTPTRVVVSNGVGYFVANGKELWRTDGTPAGTSLVTARLSFVHDVVDVNGTLYFIGGEPGVVSGIYKSDGTDAGTALVKDINPLGNAFLHHLVSYHDKLYFRGVAHNSSSESLWVSDGTAAGTTAVMTFGDYTGGSLYQPPTFLTAGKLWLITSSPQTNLRTLYVSDGTAAGTYAVGPAGQAPPSDVDAFVPSGNIVYFTARPSPTDAPVWWRSDGTAAGTVQVPGFPVPRAEFAQALGNTLFIPAYRADTGWELFKLGPTDTAASLVKELAPGAADSSPHALTPFRNGLAFFTTDGASVSLYLTDGTAANTTFVRQLPVQSGTTVVETRVLGDALYFVVREPLGGWVLYRSDGTASGTAEVKRFYGTAQPGGFGLVGGRLAFAADDGVHGLEPWVTDGTPAGTTPLRDITTLPLPTKPDSMVQFKGAIYFTFTPMSVGTRGQIYRTDGTADGTSLIFDGQASGLFVAGNLIYFTAFTPEAGVELWCTDGTAAGTRIVVDLAPGTASSNPVPVAWTGDKLIFGIRGPDNLRYELWRTDGTAAGTAKVYNNQVLYLNDGGNAPTHTPVVLNGVMYFYGEDDGTLGAQLWRTDGTASGTYQVKSFSAGSSGVNRFAVLNGVLYFTARSDTYHDSLWRSDGTAAGTTLVRADLTLTTGLNALNGALYFATDAGLWRSDGTPAGTALVSAAPLNVRSLVAVGNLVYFFDNAGLWKTDGTAGGTAFVRSVTYQPYQSAFPSQVFMANVGGTLFYSDGYDLWRSDGTFQGTYQVAKIADNSNQQWSMPFSGALAAPLGDLLLFGMMTPDGGRELRTAYVTPPAAPTGLTNSGPAPAPSPDPATGSPAAATTPAGVRLTWADNSANESGFLIERSNTADFAVVTATFFVPANTASYTDRTASAGDAYYYRVRAVNAAGASAPSNGITTPPATLLSADFLYDGPAQRLVLRFSADVAASLSLADLRLRNLTTGQDVPTSQMTLAYDPATRTATVTFAGGRLADGRYHLTLDSGDVLGANGLALDGDANGTPGGDFGLDFFTLAGDANRDGVVNFSDLLVLAKNYNKSGVTLAQGDFNGDGVVNFADLLTLAKAYNKSLPPAAAGPVGVETVGTAAMPSLSAALAQPATTPPPAPTTVVTAAKTVTTSRSKAPTPKATPPAARPVAPVKKPASPASRPTTFSTRKVVPPRGVRRK